MTLSPQQQAAVNCPLHRILLRAGAGSGKTHTLTERIRRLLREGVHPTEILALTFTRKAASEMRERLASPRVLVSTFHSWAARLIREFADLVPISRDFSIRDETDKDELLKLVAVELGKSGKKGLEVETWASKPLHPATRKRLEKDPAVVARYRQLMEEAQALDYDLLEETLLHLLSREEVSRQLRYRWLHVLVDEYQDTSQEQQAILDLLNPVHRFAVGDHAQSIYRFRGARVEGFEEERGRAHVLELATNYRSTPAIVRAANRCAARMDVPGLEMTAARESVFELTVRTPATREEELAELAEVIRHHQGEPWASIAVLSPTWDLLKDLSEVLTAEEIPCEVARKRLTVWESEQMRWLIDCMRVALNPWDHLALRSAMMAFRACVSSGQWAAWRASAISHGRWDHLALRSAMMAFRARVSSGQWAAWRASAISHGRSALIEGLLLPFNCPLDAIGSLGLGWPGLPDAIRILDEELTHLHLTHRHLSGAPLEAIERWRSMNPDATMQDLLTWYTARRMTDPEVTEPRDAVVLSTIHGAKGLEWPKVHIIGLEHGRLPRRGADEQDLEEARRLFYVACTRARDHLTLWTCADHEPSHYLSEALC